VGASRGSSVGKTADFQRQRECIHLGKEKEVFAPKGPGSGGTANSFSTAHFKLWEKKNTSLKGRTRIMGALLGDLLPQKRIYFSENSSMNLGWGNYGLSN